MKKLPIFLSLTRLTMALFCLLSFLSYPNKISATCCGCCQEDYGEAGEECQCLGLGAGRRALIAGGIVIVGGIAGVIAGKEIGKRDHSSSHSHSCHTHTSPAARGNAVGPIGGTDVTPPLGLIGTAPVGITDTTNLVGVNQTNPTNLTANNQIGTGLRAAKLFASSEEGSTLHFNYTFTISASAVAAATVIPFVELPDGNTLEGAPTFISEISSSPLLVSLAPLSLPNPLYGSYVVGIRYMTAGAGLASVMTKLEGSWMSSRDGSTAFIGESLNKEAGSLSSLSHMQSLHPVVYAPFSIR